MTVSFRVLINTERRSNAIVNVAHLLSENAPTAIASNRVLNPFEPTAVTLESFSAASSALGATVEWRTSGERETLGYYVWRGRTADRAAASRINAGLMLSKSANGGHYVIDDTGGFAGAHYWIEEVELGGGGRFYGPVISGPQPQPGQAVTGMPLTATETPATQSVASVAADAPVRKSLSVALPQSVSPGQALPVTVVEHSPQLAVVPDAQAAGHPATVPARRDALPLERAPERELDSPARQPERAVVAQHAAAPANARRETVQQTARVVSVARPPLPEARSAPARTASAVLPLVAALMLLALFFGAVVLVSVIGVLVAQRTVSRRSRTPCMNDTLAPTCGQNLCALKARDARITHFEPAHTLP
jgi:hypothetical protein